METIISFFTGIGNFIVSVFHYIVDSVLGLARVVQMLLYFTSKIPDYFGWLPPEILAIIASIFGIAVFYKILGREG